MKALLSLAGQFRFNSAMKTADRLEQIQPFRVMEVLDRAAAHEAAGHDVVHLEVGEPDFATCEDITAAGVRALEGGHTKYTSALGIAPLREAVSAYYERQGLKVDPARVVITAGASGGLMLLAAALLNPGDRLLVTDPGYPCNEVFAAAVGGRAVKVPVSANQRFQPSWQDLEAAWNDSVAGALLASPANPTGTMLSREALVEIASGCSRRGFLIMDEIYQGLTFGEVPYQSVLEVSDEAIVLQSFSKYFGMTGWRLGWVVLPDALLEGVTKLAQNLFISPPTVAQHAALAAFGDRAMQEHEARRAEFGRRRERLLAGLQDIGLDVPVASDGAFYLYVDVSATGLSSADFCRRVLDEHYVAVTPGADFGSHLSDRFVRMSYTTDMASIERALERLARAVAAFQAA